MILSLFIGNSVLSADCQSELSQFTANYAEASLIPMAINLPESRFNQGISRDECMAQMIARIYEDDPNMKSLVIIGNRHVIKKLYWEDHVPSQGKTIYQYLDERFPGIKMFFSAHVIQVYKFFQVHQKNNFKTNARVRGAMLWSP